MSVGPGVLALGSAGGQGWLLTWLALRSGVFQGCYIAGGLAEGSRVSWSLGQPAGGGVGALRGSWDQSCATAGWSQVLCSPVEGLWVWELVCAQQ